MGIGMRPDAKAPDEPPHPTGYAPLLDSTKLFIKRDLLPVSQPPFTRPFPLFERKSKGPSTSCVDRTGHRVAEQGAPQTCWRVRAAAPTGSCTARFCPAAGLRTDSGHPVGRRDRARRSTSNAAASDTRRAVHRR